MCPFAYQTSLWIRDVREQTGLAVNWRFFSLEEINRVEGKKHPWEREWSYGWGMLRVAAAGAGRAPGLDGGRGPALPDRALLFLVRQPRIRSRKTEP